MSITAYGLPVGRPPGAINIASRELKEFWHNFFSSAEYRTKAKQRILDGSAPHLESYLLNRIYGKPKEHVELSVTAAQEDLSMLSTEELTQRAENLLKQLGEMKELEESIPAEYRIDDVETSIRPSPSSPAKSASQSNTSLASYEQEDAKSVAALRDAAILAEVTKRASQTDSHGTE